MTKEEIKEQFASICESNCEGYQHEHILEAMQSYADQQTAELQSLVADYRAWVDRLQAELQHIYDRPNINHP